MKTNQRAECDEGKKKKKKETEATIDKVHSPYHYASELNVQHTRHTRHTLSLIEK